MDQRGRLQRLAWRLPGQFVRGEPAEFFIDQRQQFLGSPGATWMEGTKQACDIAHAPSILHQGPTLNQKRTPSSSKWGIAPVINRSLSSPRSTGLCRGPGCLSFKRDESGSGFPLV